MPAIDLMPANHAATHARLTDGNWVVACLCAAWCDVCTAFRPGFDRLADEHPDLVFLWIDIEDEADLVGDIDVENFPTVLIERDGVTAFYGTIEPAAGPLARLVQAQTRAGASKTPAAGSTSEPLAAACTIDLQNRLGNALGE